MKFALVTALALVLLLTAPAAALVRELDPDTEARLTQAALDQYSQAQVTATRIRDFWNIGRAVFCLTLDLGQETTEVYIDIDSEEFLTSADLDQLQTAEDEAQQDEPVPYPDTINEPDPGQIPEEEASDSTGFAWYYWLGGLAVLAGAVLLGRRVIQKA